MTSSQTGPAVWMLRGRLSQRSPLLHDLEIRDDRIHSIRPLSDPQSAPAADVEVPRDAWILPGFVDAHTHLLGVGLARRKPDLSDARSVDGALEMLKSWLDAHPADTPVIAEGWDQSQWQDARAPLRAEIDAVAGRRPVALRRVCGHVAVLGSAALEQLGSAWPDLDVESGLALEALPLQLNRLWPFSEQVLVEAAHDAQMEALRRGVTWIQEMGHGASFRAFQRLVLDDRLRVRITHFFNQEHLEALSEVGVCAGAGDAWLRVGGVKIFLDGSIGGRSAALRVPYPPESGTPACTPVPASEPPLASGNRPGGATGGAGRRSRESEGGLLVWTDAKLRERLVGVAESGFRVAMHAIGDAAVEQAVRVVERLLADRVIDRGWAPRLEHAESLPPDLLERAVAAGFWFSMQPNFTARWQGAGGLYEQRLGRERALRLNPYREAHRSGRLVFGSDCMPLDPLLGLAGALGHPDPAQRLDLSEAVEVYTLSAREAVDRPFQAPQPGAARTPFGSGDRADLVLVRSREAASSAALPLELLGVVTGGRWAWRDSRVAVSGSSRTRSWPFAPELEPAEGARVRGDRTPSDRKDVG